MQNDTLLIILTYWWLCNCNKLKLQKGGLYEFIFSISLMRNNLLWGISTLTAGLQLPYRLRY